MATREDQAPPPPPPAAPMADALAALRAHIASVRAQRAAAGGAGAGGAAAAPVVAVAPPPADAFVQSLTKTPFATLGKVPEYGRRWWFDYFWREAYLANEFDGLRPVANLMFERQGAGFQRRRDFEWILHRPAEDWFAILSHLLSLGFRAVDPLHVPHPSFELEVKGRAAEHLGLQREFFRYIEDWQQNRPRRAPEIHVYYRAERRSVERIVQDKGTRRQVDVDDLVQRMRMDEPWHPFSRPEIAGKWWFRRGQADGDLYTIVSVAKQFRTCLSFPLVSDGRNYAFPQKDVAQWTQLELDRHRKDLAVVQTAGHENRVVVRTDITAYMLVNSGAVLDTVACAENSHLASFPEQGLHEIPLNHIYAFFKVRRYHAKHYAQDGYFAAFVDEPTRWRDFALNSDLMNDEVAHHIEDEYQARVRECVAPIHTAWASSNQGYENPLVREIDRVGRQERFVDVLQREIDQPTFADLRARAQAVVAAPRIVAAVPRAPQPLGH